MGGAQTRVQCNTHDFVFLKLSPQATASHDVAQTKMNCFFGEELIRFVTEAQAERMSHG
jgi:hypothetical protein